MYVHTYIRTYMGFRVTSCNVLEYMLKIFSLSGFHLEKWARGGKTILTNKWGGKGVSVIVCLLGGLGT